MNSMDSGLERECIEFSNYLIQQNPNSYVMRKYREAHQQIAVIPTPEESSFDLFLLDLASHRFWLRWVDAYTSIFLRGATIRRKWVLLIAILESCSPTHEYFEVPERDTKDFLFVRMAAKCFSFLMKFCLSTVLLLPLYLFFLLRKKLGGSR